MNMRPMQVNLTSNTCPQCDSANHSNLTPPHGSTIQNEESTFINIPLLYNPNVPMDPEIWNGRFHLISLNGSLEHIVQTSRVSRIP